MINESMFDRFTFAHAGCGAALAFLGFGLGATLAIAVAWEIVEIPLKRAYPELFPHASQDTFDNMIGDVLGYMGGWYLARNVL